jgi:ubiquinone/menaquinone biosynthesis C-methylase UbiE
VTCIEALVNFGRPRRALAEMVRVLAPGGAVVITKRSDALARLTLGKDFTRRRLFGTLQDLGCNGELTYSPYRGSVGKSEVAVAEKTGLPL